MACLACQLFKECAAGDSIKVLKTLKMYFPTSTACPHSLGRSLGHKRRSSCQAGPAFPKPLLAGPDLLVVVHMLCDCSPDDLLHELPWH